MRFISRVFILVLLGCALAGCFPFRRNRTADQPAPVPVGPAQVQVRWLGHAAFLVTSSIGIAVVTDPFSPKAIGYQMPSDLRADLVLTSHENETANFIEPVGGSPLLLRSRLAVGVTRANGILFRGVPCGSSRSGEQAGTGVNVAFVWAMDGVRFCHLGAPMRAPSSDELAQIGPVEVLFLPAGGGLSRADADAVIAQLTPRILVPMAYRTPKATRLGLSGPEAMLAGRPNVTRLSAPTFTVARDALPAEIITLVPSVP